jgi:hypothetical protein
MSGILRAKGEIADRRLSFAIIIGWSLAYGVAALLGVNTGWALNYKGVIGEELALWSQVPFALTFGAFIGGWLTLALLKANSHRTVNWKTVLAGALGFSLGILVLIFIFSSGGSQGVQGLVWGLIGGAALAFPSRNPMRYLTLGLAIGISTALVNSLFGDNDVMFFLSCGALVGACLGLDTKRPSGVLTGLILGVIAFGLGFAISSGPYMFSDSLSNQLGSNWAAPLAFLSTGLLGAVLAAGWSYLKSSGKSEAATGD